MVLKRILLLGAIGIGICMLGLSERKISDDITVIDQHYVFSDKNSSEGKEVTAESVAQFELPPCDQSRPYWIRNNHGEISITYYEVDEDKECYIPPIIPEGFSMEEYLSSFSYTEQDKESLQDGTINDFTIEKESDPSRIVIGSDDRTRIYSVNSYPFSATAYIITTFPGGVTAEGSGFFVGPDVVVTAGHGLYSKDYGWATSATVYPGGLYSSFGYTVSYDLNVHSYFYALDLSSYDVGIIKLSSTFGNGSFGLGTVSDYNLNNDNIILYGYPGYPFASGALCYSTGTVLNVYSNQFEHDADASAGESGSPIVRNYTQFTATGIHTGTAATYNNCAVRITAGLIQYINSFM